MAVPVGGRGVFVFSLVLMAGLGANAQQSTMDAFDDLSNRAQALLDARPAEAANLYRKALEIRPNWAEGWFNLGGALYQVDRYAEATDALRKAVALAPGHGIAWALLGLSEAELDNPEQALADMRKGEELGLGPNLEFERAVRVKAARLLIMSSAFDEALDQLVPLAKQNDNSGPVIEALGMCGLAQPGRATDLTPERRAVVRLAGQATWATQAQRPAEAGAAYKQLLEQYPNEPGVHYAYGLYLMETDVSAAVAEIEKEVQIDPQHWPALVLGASLQMRQGAPDKALEWLRQAMKFVPSKYRWLCHAEMGRAHMSAENLEPAIKEFQAALRLKPSIAQVHFMLAQAYRLSGRKEDAQRETAEFQKLKVRQDPLGVPALQQVYSGRQ